MSSVVSARAWRWIDESRFDLDGQTYRTARNDQLDGPPSTLEELVLVKSEPMLERYAGLQQRFGPVSRVVELGIYQGGSTAFLAQLLQPERLVAVDISPERVAALDDFIGANSLGESVHPVYGVDQADRERLTQVVHEHFGEELLDLVVDDASHHYLASRASFSLLFPRLREGGVFVIEDWDWAHDPDDLWQVDGGYFRRYPALTNLIFEIVMLAGSRNDFVREVIVSPEIALVVRGGAPRRDELDLDQMVNRRGLPFRPLL